MKTNYGLGIKVDIEVTNKSLLKKLKSVWGYWLYSTFDRGKDLLQEPIQVFFNNFVSHMPKRMRPYFYIRNVYFYFKMKPDKMAMTKSYRVFNDVFKDWRIVLLALEYGRRTVYAKGKALTIHKPHIEEHWSEHDKKVWSNTGFIFRRYARGTQGKYFMDGVMMQFLNDCSQVLTNFLNQQINVLGKKVMGW